MRHARIVGPLLAALILLPSAKAETRLPFTVGQRVTFREGSLHNFGCRNIENAKQAFREWHRMADPHQGALAANRFFHDHDLDPTRERRQETLMDECLEFQAGETRYIDQVAGEWRDGYSEHGQMICLGAWDLDPSPPDASKPPSPKSPCYWMFTAMPPTLPRQ
jgi:hypothetical protein